MRKSPKKMLSPYRIYQQGIGLIELMVSMLIGLFIMAGVVQLFSTSSQNAVAAAGASRIQENMRYAFSRIAEDIAQSGNLGCLSVSNASAGDGMLDYMDNKLTLNAADGEANDFTTIISGDANATNATEPAGDVVDGTDTFRIRYVNHAFRVEMTGFDATGGTWLDLDTTDNDFGRLRESQVVVLSNCSRSSAFMITDITGARVSFGTAVSAGPLNIGQSNSSDSIDGLGGDNSDYVVEGNLSGKSRSYLYGGSTGSYLYYIGDSASGECELVDDAGTAAEPGNCALFRVENGNAQELVQGVNGMRVFYGWTDAAGNLRFSRASAAVDWDLVDRARVEIDFNSIDDAIVDGNNMSDLITRTYARTFHLTNQL